jgi:hypothetical protein
VGRYRRLGGTHSLHLQRWRRKKYVPPKRRCLPTIPHGLAIQKTNIDIFTTVRTWNLMLSFPIMTVVFDLYAHHTGRNGQPVRNTAVAHCMKLTPQVGYRNWKLVCSQQGCKDVVLQTSPPPLIKRFHPFQSHMKQQELFYIIWRVG